MLYSARREHKASQVQGLRMAWRGVHSEGPTCHWDSDAAHGRRVLPHVLRLEGLILAIGDLSGVRQRLQEDPNRRSLRAQPQ